MSSEAGKVTMDLLFDFADLEINETEEIPENLSENVLSVSTQTNNWDILLHDPVTVKSSSVYFDGAFFRRR